MKRSLFLTFCALAASTLAWTEAETNAVVRALGHVVRQQIEWEDCADGDDWNVMPPVPHILEYEDLFVSERAISLPFWNQWTPTERRYAFEQMLLEMPNWDIERYGVSEDKMLRFCLNYGVAAALMPARNILLSNDASVQSKRMAAKICERLASPLPSSLPASGVTNCVEQGKEKCP